VKKIFFIIIGAIIIIFSFTCHKEELIRDYCNMDDPVNELPWLREYLDSIQPDSTYLRLYYELYHNEPVFYFETMRGCIFCYTYYCDGKKVLFTSPVDETYFLNNLKKNKLLWERK
jgi:hypothetical protein